MALHSPDRSRPGLVRNDSLFRRPPTWPQSNERRTRFRMVDVDEFGNDVVESGAGKRESHRRMFATRGTAPYIFRL